jgi:hypothetical protein
MKFVSLKSPEVILGATEKLFTTLRVVAYLFIIYWQRTKTIAVFDKFDLKMDASFRAYEGRKYKVV